MYIPAAFQITEKQALDIIDAHPFALLITPSPMGCLLTHLPFLRDGNRLIGHMAGVNPHGRHLDGESTVVFSGPHAYISPRWYASALNVPTWNYQAVHVSGPCRPIADAERRRQAIDALVATHERSEWEVDWSHDRFNTLIEHIHIFELEMRSIVAKSKMSQNKSTQDIEAVSGQLDATHRAMDADVAGIMRGLLRR
jgi:transcriptional regulator